MASRYETIYGMSVTTRTEEAARSMKMAFFRFSFHARHFLSFTGTTPATAIQGEHPGEWNHHCV
jgi:hypothetical protein